MAALVSLIVPCWNEATCIERTVRALLALPGPLEVLIVDGGSTDGTAEIAAAAGATVVRSGKGRGLQLHTGAEAARGEILWFLHADTVPGIDAIGKIRATLERGEAAGGNCRLRFDGDTAAARRLTRAYPFFRLLGLCYGDASIFLTRETYLALGGFRPFPLFEDLDFVRRIKRRGRFAHLDCEIVTSSRRFEGRSFTLVFARWTLLQTLYWMGAPPHWLARIYAPVRRPSS